MNTTQQTCNTVRFITTPPLRPKPTPQKMPVDQQYLQKSKMKDGFSEGFVLRFQAGLAAAAAERKKTAEMDEKHKNCIEGKQRAKAWAIKQGIIKR